MTTVFGGKASSPRKARQNKDTGPASTSAHAYLGLLGGPQLPIGRSVQRQHGLPGALCQ